jgi:hypothetical protein
MNSAAALGTFATQHSAHIAVWGAQTLTYSQANPTCTQVNNWVNTYNWQNIFAFVDASRQWYVGGTPYYYVIDPRDSTQAYAGTNRITAQNTALSIVNALSVTDNQVLQIAVRATTSTIYLDNISESGTLVAYDLAGKQVLSTPLQEEISWQAGPGWYVFYLQTNSGEQRVKVRVL